jgi:hypothetical protein
VGLRRERSKPRRDEEPAAITRLPERLQVQDQRQDIPQNAVGAIRVNAVLVAVAEAIFVAAAKAFPKIIVVVGLVDIVATVSVISVLVGERGLIVAVPAVFAVGGACAEPFLIAVVHSLSQQIRAVLIGLIICAAAVVAINRSCIEVRIVVVIMVLVAPANLLFALAPVVILLKAVLRHSPLLLQSGSSLLGDAFLLIQALAVLRDLLLLLPNQFLLALLRKTSLLLVLTFVLFLPGVQLLLLEQLSLPVLLCILLLLTLHLHLALLLLGMLLFLLLLHVLLLHLLLLL